MLISSSYGAQTMLETSTTQSALLMLQQHHALTTTSQANFPVTLCQGRDTSSFKQDYVWNRPTCREEVAGAHDGSLKLDHASGYTNTSHKLF